MKDTIYRDEAIEICERWKRKAAKEQNGEGWYMADILLRFMKEMPSAERPRGYWFYSWNIFSKGYECTNCHKKSIAEYDYCPNCGCWMKGTDNERHGI